MLSSRRQSASSVRGYTSRSFLSLNCVGLTNTLTTVASFSLTLLSTSDACPWWSAPIVGTRPTVLLSFLRAETVDLSFSTELIISIFLVVDTLEPMWLFLSNVGAKVRKYYELIAFIFEKSKLRLFKSVCNLDFAISCALIRTCVGCTGVCVGRSRLEWIVVEVVEDGGQVALACVGEEGYYCLAFVFWLLGYLCSCIGGCAR